MPTGGSGRATATAVTARTSKICENIRRSNRVCSDKDNCVYTVLFLIKHLVSEADLFPSSGKQNTHPVDNLVRPIGSVTESGSLIFFSDLFA